MLIKKQQSLFKTLTKKKLIGNNAEDLACKFLQDKGLKLITSNFSTRTGEVDLIMKDRGVTYDKDN